MDFEDARRLVEAGRLAEAEAAYQELSRNPDQRAQCYYGLGMVYLKKQDWESAHRWFSESVKADPQDSNARFYLAELAARRGDNELATRLFAEVLTLNPRHVGALERISRLNGPTRAASPSSTEGSPAPPIGLRRTGTPPIPSAHPTKSVAPAPPQPSQPVGSVGVPPRPPSSKNSIVGRARLVKLQAVAFNGTPAAKQSLTFRLDIPDTNGNLVRTVGVEMRSFHVRGSVENGDWVEIDDISRSGKVKSLRNLSTGQQVKTRFF